MKKTLISISVITMTACTSAQSSKTNDKNPTEAVQEAFAKKYPEIKDFDWEKEGANFEAKFEIADKDYSVTFDASGKLIEEEMEIAVSELPQAASDYISTNCKGKKVKEATKIMLANDKVEYEAEIHGKDLIFDSNGKFISMDTQHFQ